MPAILMPRVVDRTIRIVREVAAPPDAVWEAWTSPERLIEWWAPPGFTTTTRGFVMLRGGTWHFTMHGTDGTEQHGSITLTTSTRRTASPT
jgi:uncharacterized protein YndB with AHSA1/START domain